MKLAQWCCNVTKQMVEKFFQNCSCKDDDVTNYDNFFWKNMRKMAKIGFFFLKLALWQLEKRFFQYLFSAFESQDNI